MFKNNSIFFKDLLIALNSKQGKLVIFFFIFIYFITFLLFLSTIKYNYSFYEISSIWKRLFETAWISQIFALTGISFFRWLHSFTSETTSKTLDFIKISPITAFKFVLWKFLASISFVMLLFMMSLPFLSIGLVLWWINISDVLIYALFTVSYSSFAVLFGMFLSSFSKSTVVSILSGIISVPIALFFIGFFLWFTTDYLWFDISNWWQNIFYAIFPVAIFDYILTTEAYINFFTLKIHYLVYHILLFVLFNSFFFYFLTQQYQKFSVKNVHSFNYIGTALMGLIFILALPLFNQALFWLIFSFLIFIYLFYIFANQPSKESKISFLHKKNIFHNKYIYFLITFIFSSIVLIIQYGFIYHSISILFLIFLLFFTFQSFLRLFFKNMAVGVFNIIYLLIIIIFFYIAPLIFTNLLDIKFKTLHSVVKSAISNDNIHENECLKQLPILKKNCIFEDKGEWIFFYYFLYCVLNCTFITVIGLDVLSKKRKLKNIDITN